MTSPEFTHDQIHRYSRHVLLPDIGKQGLENIRHGSVLWAGFSPSVQECSLYLIAAGIKKLGIAFPGRIESRFVVDLKQANPDCEVSLFSLRNDPSSFPTLLKEDGSFRK